MNVSSNQNVQFMGVLNIILGSTVTILGSISGLLNVIVAVIGIYGAWSRSTKSLSTVRLCAASMLTLLQHSLGLGALLCLSLIWFLLLWEHGPTFKVARYQQ